MRDYAIARCLLDPGLRGHEVAGLTLDSVNWHSAPLTISTNKSKRVQQLPIPLSAGQTIVHYLVNGRPQTVCRTLFVRHRAPFDQPLAVPAIRSAMNRAFVRYGPQSVLQHPRFTVDHRDPLQRAGRPLRKLQTC